MTKPTEHRDLRAKFAVDAIRGYNPEYATGSEGPQDAAQDLITDLCHLMDKAGGDTLLMLRGAIGNWSAERKDPDNPGDGGTVQIEIEDHE